MLEVETTWGGWGEDIQNDPYPHFAEIRGRCPVHAVRLGDGHDAYLVVGHDAARQALRDPRLSKDMLAAMGADPDVVDEGLPGPAFARHMLAVDPPDHTRLRGMVAKAFAPSRIAALAPRLEHIADDLLDDLERSGPVVDLVSGFALPFPFRVIGELLGVPVADQPALHDAFRRLLQPWSGSPPPDAVAASNVVVGYLEHLVDEHQRVPSDDLVGVLVQAARRPHPPGAAVQPVPADRRRARHHDEPDRQRHRRPARSPRAVAPAPRRAAADPRGGRGDHPLRRPGAARHVPSDDRSGRARRRGGARPANRCWCASAGPTTTRRSTPTRSASTSRRTPEPHLGFGHGIHFCLGAPLARLEGRIAFGALLRRFPDIALAVPRDELQWSHGDGLVLRGLAELPVRLIPDNQPAPGHP